MTSDRTDPRNLVEVLDAVLLRIPQQAIELRCRLEGIRFIAAGVTDGLFNIYVWQRVTKLLNESVKDVATEADLQDWQKRAIAVWRGERLPS